MLKHLNKSTVDKTSDLLWAHGILQLSFQPGAELTNRRGKRPLGVPGNKGAPSDIPETYLLNAPIFICVMESVKCSLTTQNGEFLSGSKVLQACESSHYNSVCR